MLKRKHGLEGIAFIEFGFKNRDAGIDEAVLNMCEAAREDVRNDPSLYSFFVVSEASVAQKEDLYVSPDWPSAETYAKKRIAGTQSALVP